MESKYLRCISKTFLKNLANIVCVGGALAAKSDLKSVDHIAIRQGILKGEVSLYP